MAMARFTEESRKSYFKVARNRTGEKLESLWRVRSDGVVVFSGHWWDANCWYSMSDLRKNNDFKVEMSPFGELKAIGAAGDIDQDTLRTIATCEGWF